MKKRAWFLRLCLLAVLLLPVTARAAGASAALTGPDTVHAGDVITLTFHLEGSGIYGLSGTLEYDAGQLEPVGEPEQVISAPWTVGFSGDHMAANNNDLSDPIDGAQAIFRLTFRVKEQAAGGTVTVSLKDVTVSYAEEEESVGTVRYTVTVARTPSANDRLESLTVGNAAITPAFDPETTYYTAGVPFGVTELDVKASAADENAGVHISNPYLLADAVTHVTVTVTAENGARRVYTIAVSRARDPNYRPSGENTLSDIRVEGFLLSPAFTPENTEYVVWLPYETEAVEISATATDALSTVRVEGGETLQPGKDNVVKVICTSEGGQEREYRVIVKRAAAHGSTPVIPDVPVDPSKPGPTIPVVSIPPAESTGPVQSGQTEPTRPGVEGGTDAPRESGGGIPWWSLLLVGIGGIGLGFAGGFFLNKLLRKRSPYGNWD